MFKSLLWVVRCGLIAGIAVVGVPTLTANDAQPDTVLSPTIFRVYVSTIVLSSVVGGLLSALAARGHNRPTAVVLAAWTWALAALTVPMAILLLVLAGPLCLLPACAVGLTAVTRRLLDSHPAVAWAYAAIVAVLGGIALARGVNRLDFPLVFLLGFPPLTAVAPLTAAVLLAAAALYERLHTSDANRCQPLRRKERGGRLCEAWAKR